MNRIEPPASSDYPRLARRLRARLGDDLHALHRGLETLARSYDVARSHSTVFDPMDPDAYFSAAVRSAMTGRILNYSSRLRLLHQARRLGINRFRANLLIAEAQHAANDAGKTQSPSSSAKSSRKLIVLVVAAIQISILTGLWFMVN